MARTSGQELALHQLRSIELASSLGFEVLGIEEPTTEKPRMWVNISMDCAGISQALPGIQLRERERFSLGIDPGFPFVEPSTWVNHGRWAGTPHVQWRYSLCLYAAPSVEWNPAGGIYSYVERLFDWLEHAATGTLDPDGAPLHPPVAYTTSGAPLVIPRTDTPVVGDDPWLGYVEFQRVNKGRYDLFDWMPAYNRDEELNTPPELGAAAVLLNETMDWEYPRNVAGLLLALRDRGVPIGELLAHLGFAAAFREQGQPLMMVVGAPMRGIAGGERRQHLTAWRIPSEEADRMTSALSRYSKDEKKRELSQEAHDAVFDWAGSAKVEWCPVREARPEVTIRRDWDSPLRSFAGKSVAVWGCGALGAPVAEWVLRAGARQLILYDSAPVAPGILVRQPYSDGDLGLPKCEVLADRLRAIDPASSIHARPRNVLNGPLARDDWHDGADVVIDTTASVAVQSKLERTRRLYPNDTTVVTMLIGHTAGHGIATVASAAHSGAGADTLRSTKLACTAAPHLRGFLDEFWPAQPRTDTFQPEPGCSSPTFTGSGAEISGLAATLLTSVAREMANPPPDRTAVAHLLALPGIDHDGPRQVRLDWAPAMRMPDPTGRFEVRLSPGAVEEMRAWIASGQRRLVQGSETGGVLFGLRDDAVGVIWVDEVSGPPPDSTETPDEFLCGIEGVDEAAKERSNRTTGSVGFLGIWHTHPRQSPDFSARDLKGMLELLDAAGSANANGLIVIVGWSDSSPELASYVFENEDLRRDRATITVHDRHRLEPATVTRRNVGLALSGGGSRAVAFHLGCLRALHDRGVLNRIRVVSGVSGGSVIAAMWAYWPNEDFDSFEARTIALLQRGLQRSAARHLFLGRRGPEAAVTAALAGSSAKATASVGALRRTAAGMFRMRAPAPIDPPLHRWVSRTDAFEDALAARLFGSINLTDPRREGVDVVLNACDLRTGSAFRFGSVETGTWRLGTLPGNDVALSTAVAASAAYPLLLPAIDRTWEFERGGARTEHRVVLTDGGVFDNLGTSCLEPGRSSKYSTNVLPVDYIVACDAGRGLLEPTVPFSWTSRISRTFESTFRKVQDSGRARLHAAVATGSLRGFVHAYLGQLDARIPGAPADLVPRAHIQEVPTDFAAMNPDVIETLGRRGEQLTRALVAFYCPDL